jgi:excisionase family DNA binding protein
MRTVNTAGVGATARLRAWAARMLRRERGITDANGFTSLIDAKAAARLLGVPHTWLLAQARAGQVPHHRLGHYVRFNSDDLSRWLAETRCGPGTGTGQRPR